MKQIKTLFLSIIISFGAYSQETEVVIPSDNDSKLININEKVGENHQYNVKGQLLNGTRTGEWIWSHENFMPFLKVHFMENGKCDLLTAYSLDYPIVKYDIKDTNINSKWLEGKANSLIEAISEKNGTARYFSIIEEFKYLYPNGQTLASCSSDGVLKIFSSKGAVTMKGKLMPNISNETIDTSEIMNSFIRQNKSFFELIEPFGGISRKEICFLRENLSSKKFKYYWDGDINNYWENGKTKSRVCYKKGIPNRDFYFSYDNIGNLIGKETYLNECLSVDSAWHENGNLKTAINYKGNDKDGSYLEFDINGKILTKKYFTLNKKDGVWYQYYENGKIMGKTGFKLGQNDGEFIVYFEDGRIRFKATYKDGKRLGNITYNDGTKQTIITDGMKQMQIESEMGIELRKYYESKK